MAKSKRGRRLGNAGDDAEATELQLYIDNDSKFYRQAQAIGANLIKHVCRGNFTKVGAAKAYQHLTDAGGKAYAKEFGSPGWHYPVAARGALAKEYADGFVSRLKRCRLRDSDCGDLRSAVGEAGMKTLRSARCSPGGELNGARRQARRR
jgi:hypothetical protein